jgi:hypothetical protein
MYWRSLQPLFASDLETHYRACAAAGLVCPLDVFSQLVHDPHDDALFAETVRFIDWTTVEWSEQALSGIALRHVGVPRAYQHAVDEVRARVIAEGLTDHREAVLAHWREAGSWLQPPILVDGEVFDQHVRHLLLVGFTRLGNLLGLLDRGELAEPARHRVWLGSPRNGR